MNMCCKTGSRHTPCAVADGTRSVPATILNRGPHRPVLRCCGRRQYPPVDVDCQRSTIILTSLRGQFKLMAASRLETHGPTNRTRGFAMPQRSACGRVRWISLRRIVTAIVAWVAPVLFCFGADRTATLDVSFIARIDGTTQRYVALPPPRFDISQRHPILLVLHGHGSDRWQYIRTREGSAARRGMWRRRTRWSSFRPTTVPRPLGWVPRPRPMWSRSLKRSRRDTMHAKSSSAGGPWAVLRL